METNKIYDPKKIETKWRQFWADNSVYTWDPDQPRENTFVIDTPPPTVSGTLHMGHIFSYTQTDFIARYQRMKGKTVYYPIGFDDNGLPTERLVEKITNTNVNIVGRPEFIKKCQDIVEKEEIKFRDLFESIALSIDWSLQYQTIGYHCKKISQLSFLDLYNKNLVYKQMQPTFWDPVDRTALAQADIVEKELPSTMNYIIFETENSGPITIATTRPELIPAAVAIFYHPDDVRYQYLANTKAITPLFGTIIPILPNNDVKMQKGTGLVMCSTFGDAADVSWWKKYSLPLRIIIDSTGKIIIPNDTKICQAAFNKISGLTIVAARKKIISMLSEKKLLQEQIPVIHQVKCAERSGSPMEILVTPQWFIKILDHKKEFLEKANECNWYPKNMKIRMDQWINGLNWDWCISRQRFFGVSFPVWYSKRLGEEGRIIVADEADLPVDPLIDLPRGYDRSEVFAETDVMDTWATSSLTPQINSHGISDHLVLDDDRHQKLFPADLRPQAHEIIRSWAFYTIVKSCLHQNTIPWKNVMVSGWCLASDKDKMSKSKGNIISPVGLINMYGADVVRYWASTAKLGNDIIYSEKIMTIGRRLTIKLLNATKFVSTHLNTLENPLPFLDMIANKTIYAKMDLWLLAKLSKTIEEVDQKFSIFEYYSAKTCIEQFFWNDFCDNYLEIIKNRVYDNLDKNPNGKLSAIYTLYYTIDSIIKLFAPFMPFITEELYQTYFRKYSNIISVHSIGNWPKIYYLDQESETIGEYAINILDTVRKIKTNKKMSQKTQISELIIGANNGAIDANILEPILEDLAATTNTLKISLIQDNNILTDYNLKEQIVTNDEYFIVSIKC